MGRQIPDRIVTYDVRGESPPLRVLLVDWPHHGLPSALIAAGARVFGLSPRTGALGMFIAGTPGEDGHLFFRRLHEPVTDIDIVAVHGEPDQLLRLLATLVLPIGARAIWVTNSARDVDTQAMATLAGVVWLEGDDLVDVVTRYRRHP